MIGIFDSGVGGFNAFYELRQLLPLADILYLADRKNAPYGTKTKDELLSLIKKDIFRLRERGADIILIACCTASAVYGSLAEEERRICVPIITPAAVAAEGKRVSVIATEATVRCRAFSREIVRAFPDAQVREIPAQLLVREVELGARSGRLTRGLSLYLDALCDDISSHGCDTLLLGCTHFSHLEDEFSKRLPSTRIVSPAREGARALSRLCKENSAVRTLERGRTVYM